jgi:hypothetical protein
MRLINSVGVTGYPRSVLHHSGQTYVGHDSGVDVIKDGKSSPLTAFNGLRVDCIRQHKGLLYLLCYSNSCWSIRVYRADGSNLIRSWNHKDKSSYTNKFIFYQDILYIPNRLQNKIQTYTGTGASGGEDLPVNLSTGSSTSLCTSSSQHLVLTQRSPSLVVCLS